MLNSRIVFDKFSCRDENQLHQEWFFCLLIYRELCKIKVISVNTHTHTNALKEILMTRPAVGVKLNKIMGNHLKSRKTTIFDTDYHKGRILCGSFSYLYIHKNMYAIGL